MHRLRIALPPLVMGLLIFAAAIHPQVADLVLLASALLALEAALGLRAIRQIQAGVREMAEDHLEALALAQVVQALAREATTAEAVKAMAMLEANPAMARGMGKVMGDMARAMAAKGANGER